ncbi:hypothetical protein Plhal304r1_c051g0134761 [Plasmopara halstedii]
MLLRVCSIVVMLLTTVFATDTRHLTDSSPPASNGEVHITLIAGVVAAAAVVIVVVVVVILVNVYHSSDEVLSKNIDLLEVVISPSHPSIQPTSDKKQFVYTAHI